jgi:hypothetical protein
MNNLVNVVQIGNFKVYEFKEMEDIIMQDDFNVILFKF